MPPNPTISDPDLNPPVLGTQLQFEGFAAVFYRIGHQFADHENDIVDAQVEEHQVPDAIEESEDTDEGEKDVDPKDEAPA